MALLSARRYRSADLNAHSNGLTLPGTLERFIDLFKREHVGDDAIERVPVLRSSENVECPRHDPRFVDDQPDERFTLSDCSTGFDLRLDP